MHPSAIHKPGSQPQELRRELARYTEPKVLSVFGEHILKTNYYLSPEGIVRDAWENNALDPEESKKAGELCQAGHFKEAADSLGFTEAVPSSVWAIKSVGQARSGILPKVVWDDQMRGLAKDIMISHRLGEPGNYQPAHLTGPTGASKTFAFQATYAVAGIACEVIRAQQSSSSDVNIEMLEGGDKARIKDRAEHFRDMASFACFQNPRSRYLYYRELNSAIKRDGINGVQAHDNLSRETLDNLANIDGLPKDGETLGVNVPGMAERVRRAGGVVVFDEVNLFPPDKLPDVFKFMNTQGERGTINCGYGLTSNPASEEYGNRFEMTADLRTRQRPVQVQSRSELQTQAFVENYLGVPNDDPTSSSQVLEEVIEILRADGTPEDHIDQITRSRESALPFVAKTLPPPVAHEMARRISLFHSRCEQASGRGKDLDLRSKGVAVDGFRPSIRSLCSFLDDWNQRVLSHALNDNPQRALVGGTEDLLNLVDVQYAVLAANESITDIYERPGTLVVSGSTQVVGPDDPIGGAISFFEHARSEAKLDPSSLMELAAEVTSAQSMIEDKFDGVMNSLAANGIDQSDVPEPFLEFITPLKRDNVHISKSDDGQYVGAVEINPLSLSSFDLNQIPKGAASPVPMTLPAEHKDLPPGVFISVHNDGSECLYTVTTMGHKQEFTEKSLEAYVDRNMNEQGVLFVNPDPNLPEITDIYVVSLLARPFRLEQKGNPVDYEEPDQSQKVTQQQPAGRTNARKVKRRSNTDASTSPQPIPAGNFVEGSLFDQAGSPSRESQQK